MFIKHLDHTASPPAAHGSSVNRWRLVVLLLVLVAYIAIVPAEFGLFSLSPTNLPSQRSLTLMATTTPALCPAQQLGYRSIFCPLWPHEKMPPSSSDPRAYVPAEDLPLEIHHLLRYIYSVQNPPDCSTAKYYSKDYQPGVGFGAALSGSIGSAFSQAAVPSKRVFHIPPQTFPYGTCEGEHKGWECFFEPLSRCTPKDAQAIVDKAPPGTLPAEEYGASGAYRDENLQVVHAAGWLTDFGADNWDGYFSLPKSTKYAAGLMYMMRLNARTRQIIERHLQDSIPCDFDPERTISLPIRASDKCNDEKWRGETDCLPLETYMQAAEYIKKRDPKVNTIILTSEDRRVLETNRTVFEQAGWRFILNSADVAPGTGNVDAQKATEHGMDAIFLSMISSLHLTMRGKYFLLNCASNYHAHLKMLVDDGGCSLMPKPITLCLNDQEGPWRICGFNDYQTIPYCIQKKKDVLEAAAAAEAAAQANPAAASRRRRSLRRT